MRLFVSLTATGVLSVAEAHFTTRGLQTEGSDKAYFFVGFSSPENKGAILQHDQLVCRHEFDEVGALAVVVPLDMVAALKDSPYVTYVEEDQLMYPDSEITPYGIAMTQMAGSNSMPSSTVTNSGTSLTCADSGSFKIGIVDSGLEAGHPDLPCYSEDDPQCIGSEFGLDSTDKWYNPLNPHGSHVAGTIGALSNNGIGVKGMIQEKTNVCYVIARVFGNGESGARFSDILSGLKWTIGQGAKVVNMSLGGTVPDSTAAKMVKEFFAMDRIIVASAGNSGTSDYRYPASYDTVLSVAAIDEDEKTAAFSQYNDQVDLTGPGVDILSTIPIAGEGGILTISTSDSAYFGGLMKLSPSIPDEGISKKLFYCDNYAKQGCEGANDMVCLVERGELTFQAKALECQKAGAAATIVFNNRAGSFDGTLSENTQVTIPVLSLSDTEGATLRDNHVGGEIEISLQKGYGYMSGTSMSAPHVTGAIAVLWRACPDCKNTDIINCLKSTAKDLGDKGRDNVYGAGLIQTHDAYGCLQESCCLVQSRELENEWLAELVESAPTSSRIPSVRENN